MTRDDLESVRDAVGRLERVRLLIETGGDDWRAPSVKGSGISDPTAARALARMKALEGLEAEQAELEAVADWGRRLISGIGRGLGIKYAQTLEGYYLGRLSWAEVARRLGVSKSTALLWRDTACEWADSVGHARAMEGTGTAT